MIGEILFNMKWQRQICEGFAAAIVNRHRKVFTHRCAKNC